MDEDIRGFWDTRAACGDTAGTNDYMLKSLELKLFLEMVPSGASVLDIGCGNGATLMALADKKSCRGVGIDFSEQLVELARNSCETGVLGDKLVFHVGSIPGLNLTDTDFDCVLTERCLINLDDASRQREAFLELMSLVRVGGRYLMVESSQQGLARINELRETLELDRIVPPWHNVFLDETDVDRWGTDQYRLEQIIPFSSTYYFLSRVIYARLAKDRGEELRYDSEINKIACMLPAVGDLAPTRMWVWRRDA